MKFEDLKQEILDDAGPVRRLASPTVQFLRVSVLCLFVISAFVYWVGPRHNIEPFAINSGFWLEFALLCSIAVIAGLGALRLAIPGLTTGNQEKIYAATGIFLWFMLLLYFSPEDEIRDEPDYICTTALLIVSSIVAPLFYGMLLKAAPLRPFITGFFATLFCTTVGALALHFVCETNSWQHLLLWHFLPTIVPPIVLLGFYARFISSRD